MFKTFIILIFTFFTLNICNAQLYKNGIPITNGIETFINKNSSRIIQEYNKRVDSIYYDINIESENLSVSENGELGVFYFPNEILITNEERFIAYEFNDLKRFKQKNSNYRDRTVKAVIFHELTHAYFYQLCSMLQDSGVYISQEYRTFQFVSNKQRRFSSEFIEEGICEYVVYLLKEANSIEKIEPPTSENELTDEVNEISLKYYYSVQYLKSFLDKHGLKNGITMIVKQPAPSYNEILHPEVYFKRLEEK